jgi:hypothetical protein
LDAVRVCIGVVLDERNVLHSYGFLIGPRLLLAAAAKPDAGRLFVQWHAGQSTFPIEPTQVGSRGIALFALFESPPESDYAPPLPLGELSGEAEIAVHWGEASSDAKVVSNSKDGSLFLQLARDPGRPIAGAPVLNRYFLMGVIGEQQGRIYQAIGIQTLFREWSDLPWFGALRTEIFWSPDELFGARANGPVEIGSKTDPAQRQASVQAGVNAPAPSKWRPSRISSSAGMAGPEEPVAFQYSESVQDSLGWAQAVREIRTEQGDLGPDSSGDNWRIGAHEILLGLLLHRRTPGFTDTAHFLWGWLDANKPRGVASPLEWLDLPKGELPTSPSLVPTEFAGDARALLAGATACARAVSSTSQISMRHLVGALLLGSDASTHAHAAGLVGEKGLSFRALSEAYLEFIEKTMPAERDAWLAWARPGQNARQESAVKAAKTPGQWSGAPGTVRAGYDADLPFGQDQLDIEDEVTTLCSVILDEKHPPPLSIGLFGDWGSGKSFFLGKMQERIRGLTADAREARKRSQKTVFVGRAPQIEFNAWHFADANLWASLVTHLFAELHREIFGRKPSADEVKAEELYRELETTQKRIEALEREKRAADDLVREAQGKHDRANTELQDGKHVIETFRRMSAESVKKLVLEKPEVKGRAEELSRTLGRGQKSVAELQALGQDLLTTSRRLIRFAKESWVLLVVVLLLIGFGTALALPGSLSWLDGLQERVAGIVTALVGAVALTRKAVPYLKGAKRFLRTAEAARQDMLRESQGKVDQAETALKEAAERLATEQGKKQRLEKEIEEARRGLGLESFLQQRMGDSNYKAQLGIVSMVRQDFDTLTARLRSPGIEIVDAEGKASVETVDRVILYIDDLDRCPPDRVVEVLQAVHLLCGLPLFVVVVAADPRWLLHSLRKHYAELLHTEGGDERELPLKEASHWESTPQQYLEKIFQIPYTLPPMDEDGFRKLVKSLVSAEREPPGKRVDGQRNVGPATRSRTAPPPADGGTRRAVPRPAAPGPATSAKPAQDPALEQKPVVEQEWKPSFDLAPSQLDLGEDERKFLEELSPLVSTPRSTKRLVNVYRLLRANLSGDELARLEAGEYRSLQILLGILIGFPDLAPEFFRQLHERRTDPWTLASELSKEPKAPRAPDWCALDRALGRLGISSPLFQEFREDFVRTADSFIRYIDEVSRYSFRAGHVLRSLGGDERRAGPDLNSNVAKR